MFYDAVFHFDQDAAKLSLAISNITNYMNVLPNEHFSVVLVVNGPGITCLGKDDPQAAAVAAVAARGVSVRVCQNALRHFQLTPEWLNPVCTIVPAGVIELVTLQRQGFAYVKP